MGSSTNAEIPGLVAIVASMVRSALAWESVHGEPPIHPQLPHNDLTDPSLDIDWSSVDHSEDKGGQDG